MLWMEPNGWESHGEIRYDWEVEELISGSQYHSFSPQHLGIRACAQRQESKLTLGGVEVTPSELEIAEREIRVFIYGYLLMGRWN